jgi:cytochrome c biogenesis protein CcmG/thiol:disulfide interchange protein DsbE
MKLVLSIAVLIFSAIFFAACAPSSAPRIVTQGNTTPAANTTTPTTTTQKPAADFTKLGWELQSGATQKMADYRGKVLVLDFWATYCPPCLEEIPDLQKLQNDNKAQGLIVIGLNVGGPDDEPKIPAFVKKLHIKYDLGFPEDDLVDALLRGTAIPQTFVFGRDGKLVNNFTGYGPAIKEGMEKTVQEALAN